MKKSHIALLISTFTYSGLFYNQGIGINCLLYLVVVIALLVLTEPALIRQRNWTIAALTALISSVNLAWHGTEIAYLASVLGFFLMTGFSIAPKASWFIALGNAANSLLWGPLQHLDRLFNPKEEQKRMGLSLSTRRLVVILIPLGIAGAFVALYRSANSVFDQFVASLTLDFFTFFWVMATIVGFVLGLMLFYPSAWKALNTIDSEAQSQLFRRLPQWRRSQKAKRQAREERPLNPAHLAPNANHFYASDANPPVFNGKPISSTTGLKTELLMGVVLLVMLNLLILGVNAIDVNYVWILQQVPKGLNHSEYVHGGVNSLIFSIVLAVSIILWFFRRNLNFYSKNGWLKGLAYGWIAQNAFLVLSTLGKNWMYVEFSGLTEKRIGVFIWLFLTLIGLTLTLIKVRKRKSGWFMARNASWAFYAVMVLATFVNWHRLIVRFNLNYATKPSVEYLLRLNDTVVPELIEGAMAGNIKLEKYESQNLSERAIFIQDRQQKIMLHPSNFPSWTANNHDIYIRLNEPEVVQYLKVTVKPAEETQQ